MFFHIIETFGGLDQQKGTTDSPGHKGALGLYGVSISTLTGTRLTTFTKLPVASSGGNKLKVAPAPG